MSPHFSQEEVVRYSRNSVLAEIGWAGQKRLKSAGALIVGVGGIGSPAALYLAATGVGRIGIVDGDSVELSNLQRQVIFRTDDVRRVKVDCAQEAISALNPHCEVDTYHTRLGDAARVREIVRNYDVVIDGSDNFCTRFLVADCCWIEGIPLVSASAVGFEGQLQVVIPTAGNPCYRCLIPEPEPESRIATCSGQGILGGVVGVMGSLAVVEAVKLILGHDPDMAYRFLAYDGFHGRFITAERVPDPECCLCGGPPPFADSAEQGGALRGSCQGTASFRNQSGVSIPADP
ncbi:MAG: HesA/MoeB/ThiF family protein [Deltaproteobacteria bacterium]|nr:HesA/MoeB/ThiF family protein [Deltaproteobacteria bacterium]